MATLLIRDLDPEVKARLRRQAAANGRSMEAEARAALQDAVGSIRPARRLGTFIHQQFTAVGGAELSIPPRDSEARSADLG
jgi:plasmid stability protein